MSAPQLSLTLKRTETQLGKPLRVEIVAVDVTQKITALDLRPWEQSFGVVVEESVSNIDDARWPGRKVGILRLLLYPRRTGDLTLTSLQLGAALSSPQRVHVSEGMQGGTPISVATRLSSTSPWERQQVVLQLEITTPDTFASLEAADTIQMPGVDVLPLKWEREQQDTGAVLRLGWVLSARAAGLHNIELPPVRYNLSGRTERVYYFPKMPLHVRPLPPYIPPTMPVGKVAITSSVSRDAMLKPDELSYWTVSVQGETVSPRNLHPVLRQAESNDRLRFSSADSTRTWQAETQRSHVVHRIPFKALANGRLALPELQVQYFDPDTGRLARVGHTPPRPWVLSLAWRVVIAAATSAFTFWLCLRLFRLARRSLQHRRQRNAALAAIHQAADAWQLRQSLEAVSHAEGFPANLTLRDWAAQWRARHRPGPTVDVLVERLSRACYGQATVEDNNAKLKQAFYTLYRSNRAG